MRILLFLLLFILPDISMAQTLSLDLGEGGGQLSSRIIQLLGLITVISLAPSILVMVTSFTRIVIVFSFLRSALGLQQTPPNSVLISLALFITFFVMEPVFMKSYEEGLKPLINEEISEKDAIDPITMPFHGFMMKNVRDNDLQLFIDMSTSEDIEEEADVPFSILIPAFMISELRRAFEIGFLIFIPFLIIDMMVASTLMAMGMMMLPPVLISLPFKLVFFVLIDGWHLVVSSLVQSFS